jgi:hypothetical protein
MIKSNTTQQHFEQIQLLSYLTVLHKQLSEEYQSTMRAMAIQRSNGPTVLQQ